jgi:hypothetical protein
MADDALAELSERLIRDWDRMAGQRAEQAGDNDAAQFEGMVTARRPRGGLAIGRSIDPNTRKARMEMRVTASAGPNYLAAQKLAQVARADGLEVILKVVKNAIMGVPPPAAVIAGRRVPLHMGASVANRESAAGTLGAFVKLPDGSEGILSCSHVFARTGRKWGNIGDPIHQPGQPEERPVVAVNQVGRLSELFAPFIDNQTQNMDAAVARLDRPGEHLGNVIPDHPCVPAEFRGRRIGAPLDDETPEPGLRVVKLGRTTGFTEATLAATDFQNLRVQLGRTKTFTFSGVYEVLWDADRDFAAGGDSGALVMSRDGLHPVGLHFASMPGEAGAKVSYVIPWFRISEVFGLGLL